MPGQSVRGRHPRGPRSDCAGAFPCAPLQTKCVLLSHCAPSLAPRCMPGWGQAPTWPRSASSPPLLSAQGSSPGRQRSSRRARNSECCARVLYKGVGDEPGVSGVGGRVTGGTSADEPGYPVAFPLAFKRGCPGMVSEGQGDRWLVSSSERCEIPFPTHSCLEKRQEAAALAPPRCLGQPLAEWEGKPEARREACGS